MNDENMAQDIGKTEGNRISDEELQQIAIQMQQAMESGLLDEMFSKVENPSSPAESTKEILLQSISPGMKLHRSFFMKIYGYSVTSPEFKIQALDSLQVSGCSRAYEYYEKVVSEYEQKQKETMKPTGNGYKKKG